IDLIDMRTRKDGEFKWIAYVRDYFSRFSWACVLTDKCAAKRPQTQGSVERVNYILKDKLGKWLEDRQSENEDLCWTVSLATIVYSMNLSVCHATNKRPFELVFGHEPRIRYEENIPDDVQIEDDIQSDDDEDSVQTEYYDDEFNENLIQNLLQSENSDRDS
ncbi:20853_t:CDS:2, partial [Gigaspora margarita]